MPPATAGLPPAPAARLGHAHLRVTDLAASTAFYLLLPGFRVAERVASRYAFLTGGGSHHELALQQAANQSGLRPGTLYHLAFELPAEEALHATRVRFAGAGFASDLVDHGISHAAYLQDPDGNGVELYVDRRQRSGIGVWGGRTRLLTASG